MPDTFTESAGRAGSLLLSVIVPVCAPPAVGEKRMTAFWNDPGPTLNGVEGCASAKRPFELVAELIVRRDRQKSC